MQRWDQSTDVAVNRRAERIFKTMEWDLQARFEHLDDGIITGPGYLDAILGILDVLAGEKQATEMRRVVRRALFEGTRRGDESISQFTLRREQEFSLAEKYLPIPETLKGIMLEEQANLGKQGTLNLRTLTGGSNDFRTVTQALKVLDLDEEGLASKGKASGFVAYEECENGDSDSEASSIASQDQTDILAEIEKLDLDEQKAMEVFLALEKERRSWKDNKRLKLAQKKDRRHFSERSSRPYGAHGAQRPRPRRGLNVDAIKKVSRCSNCGERGHCAEDCKRPYTGPRQSAWSRRKEERGRQKGVPWLFRFWAPHRLLPPRPLLWLGIWGDSTTWSRMT